MASKLSTAGKFTMSYRRNETPIVADDRRIQDFIRHWREVKPQDEAFVFVSVDGTREVVTWRELHDNAVEYAHAFLQLGLKLQDIIGIAIRASPQCLYLHFGAIFAGMVPIAIDFTAKDCTDVVALLKTLPECNTFILDPNQEDIPWPTFRSLFTSVDKHGNAFSKILPTLKYLIPTCMPNEENGYFLMDDLLCLSSKMVQQKLPSVEAISTAFLFQTSGSTGLPKAVAHSHKAIILQGLFEDGAERKYLNRIFSWMSCWPRNVISSQTWITQSKLTSPKEDTPNLIMKIVRQERCSAMQLHPHQIEDIMYSLEADSEPWMVNNILTLGQHASRNVSKCLGLITRTFTNSYGSTEMLEVLKITIQTGELFEDGCCGAPVEGVEVKIVDENDKVVPVNTPGELLVRGVRLFKSYYNNEKKTRSVMTSDGWFRSDDVARMTEDGMIFVEGRTSDVIICRGVTVWPISIENVLMSYPGVRHAIIVPIPHGKFCREICACIIGDSDISENKIRKFCEDGFVVGRKDLIILPAYYQFYDIFPRTSTGKFSRNLLAQQANGKLNN